MIKDGKLCFTNEKTLIFMITRLFSINLFRKYQMHLLIFCHINFKLQDEIKIIFGFILS